MKIMVFSICLLLGFNAWAGDRGVQYGWSPVISSISTNLDGPSETRTDPDGLSAIILYPAGRDARFWAQLQYDNVVFDAGTANIGQTVTSMGVSTLYQVRFRAARNFKPWVGIGFGIASEQYKKRFTVDDQGYLATSVPNADNTNITAEMNVSVDVDLFDDWDTGITMRYQQPINDGIKALQASFYILF